MLVTVLGEFVLPHDGAAWTQTLIDAMAELGVSEKATRQALVRLEDDDWLRRSRDGRRTRWHLTDRSRSLLEAGAGRIYRHGLDVPTWDGRWSILLASVPDDAGADRHRLAVGLNWAGYGSLGQGTWICPWVDREPEAVRAVEEAGIARSTSFVGSLGALGEGRELAARAWDLEALAAEYAGFVDWADAVDPAADGGAAFRLLTDAVHRWRRFPALDPQLPDALRPEAWPIGAAAGRFAAVREGLGPAAAAWWFEHEDRYGRN